MPLSTVETGPATVQCSMRRAPAVHVPGAGPTVLSTAGFLQFFIPNGTLNGKHDYPMLCLSPIYIFDSYFNGKHDGLNPGMEVYFGLGWEPLTLTDLSGTISKLGHVIDHCILQTHMCLLCTHTHILHVSTSGQEFMQFCIIFPKLLVLRSSGSTSPADARTARYLEIYCRVLVMEHGNGKSPNSMVVSICFNGKVV